MGNKEEKIEEETKAAEGVDAEIDNIGIGEKKVKKYLKPKPVEVKSYQIENKQGNDCLVVSVAHPDNKDDIKISGIKLKKFNKLKQQGLWIGLDEDGSIPFDSGLAELLRVAKVDCIKDLIGKDLNTDVISMDTPILVFKGY